MNPKICPEYEECKKVSYFSRCLTDYENCEYFNTQDERDIWSDQDIGLIKLLEIIK